MRSPPVSCATEAAAAEVVALLRRLGSWQQRPRPPRLLVVINPYSGQGRCVSAQQLTFLPYYC